MAIKDNCETCGQVLSVPEDFRGKKVRCPSCGSRSTVLTAEDRQALERKKEEESRKARDRERLALMQKLDTVANTKSVSAEPDRRAPTPAVAPTTPLPKDTPLTAEAGGDEPMRDMADLVLFFAYLLPLLALGAGLMPLVVGGDLGLKLAFLVGALVVGATAYVIHKWLSEYSRYLAEGTERDRQILRHLVQIQPRPDPDTETRVGLETKPHPDKSGGTPGSGVEDPA